MIIQEYRGVRGLVCAEVLSDTNSAITFGDVFKVAGVSEISKTTITSSETHYYNNTAAIVIDGTGADELTIQTSAIPFDVLAKITGQEYDETKGLFIEGERESKYFALGYVTEKTDGTEVYVWRFKGKFNIPDSIHKTKDDGTESTGQELVYKGINTTYKFTSIGKRAKAFHIDKSVSRIYESVFFSSVQTPDTIDDITPQNTLYIENDLLCSDYVEIENGYLLVDSIETENGILLV